MSNNSQVRERKQAIKGLLYIISLITDTQKIVQIRNYAEILYFQNKRRVIDSGTSKFDKKEFVI